MASKHNSDAKKARPAAQASDRVLRHSQSSQKVDMQQSTMDILNDDDSGDLTDVSQDTFDTRLEKAIESRLDKLFERYEQRFEERWSKYEESIIARVNPLITQKVNEAKTEINTEVAKLSTAVDECTAATAHNSDDIEQLKSDMRDMKTEPAEHSNSTNGSTEGMAQMQDKYAKLEAQFEEHKRMSSEIHKELVAKIESVEFHSRKLNLVFDGIKPTEAENCKQKIESIIRHDMGLPMPSPVDVAHRQYNTTDVNRKVPITVRFKTLEDKNRVLQNSKKLQRQRIYIRPDAPQSYVERRSYLSKYLHLAQIVDPRARLVKDKLSYDRKLYTVDNIHMANLTSDIHTTNTDDQTRFYGHTSPFSNFYKSKFQLYNIEFSCVEQAIMYHRARQAGDRYTAYRILREDNPVTMKRLGNQYRPKTDLEWSQEEVVVKEAVTQKFARDDLKQQLLDTGEKRILECNPYDRVYSTGVPANDIGLDTLQYPGKNVLGKILEEVRAAMALTVPPQE